MKKVLFTVAALGLAAGLATSASALELKVKGGYLVEGYSVSNSLGRFAPGSNGNGFGTAMATTTDPNSTVPTSEGSTASWFMHKFTINADMIVNDAISIKSRIRLVDWSTIWGSQDDTSVGNGANFAVKRLWMVYKSSVGQWEIGRRPAGAWENEFVNTSTRGDRIMWKSGKMFGDNFSMYAFYQKITEGDAYYQTQSNSYEVVRTDGGVQVVGLDPSYAGTSSDLDNDYYEVYAAFTGYGKTSIAAGYKRDNSKDVSGGWSTEVMRIKGYGQYPLTDMFGLEFEFDYIFGDKDMNNAAQTSYDISGMAFMADFDMNFGAASANFTYFYISGDDDATDTDLDAYSVGGGTGADFEPLYILTGTQTGLLNNDSGSINAAGVAARTAGVHGLVASADFQASEKLGFHGALGWGQAASERPGYDSDYGFEFDAGASYKLLDNLTYNLHFGWMSTGDFFKMGDPLASTNDITLLYNNLNMSF